MVESKLRKKDLTLYVYEYGKPKLIPTLEIPIEYNNKKIKLGDLIELLDNKIELYNKNIETLKKIITLMQTEVELNKKNIELIKGEVF